jgi:hypothetical protein
LNLLNGCHGEWLKFAEIFNQQCKQKDLIPVEQRSSDKSDASPRGVKKKKDK